METIGIIFLTGFLGYQIASSKNESIRNISEKDNGPEDMPSREKPNSLNIYNSNKVNDLNILGVCRYIILFDKRPTPIIS